MRNRENFQLSFYSCTLFRSYQVIRTEPLNADQASAMRQLMQTSVLFDFWKEPQPGRAAEVMADAQDLQMLLDFLADNAIGHTIKIHDVQK